MSLHVFLNACLVWHVLLNFVNALFCVYVIKEGANSFEIVLSRS